MKTTYEAYTDVECPRCGYTEARDDGPYEPSWLDAGLPPLDPRVHLMWCGRCSKPFDVIEVENPCETCQQHAPDGSDGLMLQQWSNEHACMPPAFRALLDGAS